LSTSTRARKGTPRTPGTPVQFKSKSGWMRALFAEGKTVVDVARIVEVDYAFAYDVAKRSGYVMTAARRRGQGGPVAAVQSYGRARPMLPAPSVDDLARARTQYKQVEPRDLFYRAATDLLSRAHGANSVLNLGEALAVLLFTWNQAFYRYHPPGPEHITALEHLLAAHEHALEAAKSRTLTSLDSEDGAEIESLFLAFEQLLGPVGAAKALHLLAPNFFPIWDRRIAARYVGELGIRGRNASRYVAFMTNTAAQCLALQDSPGAPPDPVKALDEWNYVRITRGLS
jgi:hypothetical protein